MNLVQLVETMRSDYGISGAVITTVQEPLAPEVRRLRNWIIRSWEEVQKVHENWEFLRITSSYVLTVGETVLAPTEYLAGSVRTWREDSFRIAEPGGGYDESQELLYVPYDRWIRYEALQTTVSGKPATITVRPRDKALMIDRAADKAYELYYDYQRNPQTLSADTDTPLLPNATDHMVIVYKAAIKYGRFEAAPDIIIGAREEYRRELQRLQSIYLPMMTIGPNG